MMPQGQWLAHNLSALTSLSSSALTWGKLHSLREMEEDKELFPVFIGAGTKGGHTSQLAITVSPMALNCSKHRYN